MYSGASVQALADFFVNANVTGVDIDLSRVRFGQDHPRISFAQLDATDRAASEVLGSGWDLVLDDGSHDMRDQYAAFLIYAPLVQPGGLYVIEDIDGSDEQALGELRAQLDDASTRLGFWSEWHDMRRVKGQFDDIVAVMRR